MCLCCVFAGCSTSRPSATARTEPSILERAAAAGFVRRGVETSIGTLQIWHKDLGSGDVIDVYIEGDGRAWASRTRPSNDPTPTNPVAFELALKDTTQAVLYVARPCQYQADKQDAACDQRYWTSHRYGETVVAAIDEVLEQLMVARPATELQLIGFSGGGTLAALLAARRSDVVGLTTVAGNLNIDAWAKHHRVTPLSGSLNPANFRSQLQRIPQRHFVGTEDTVVPAELTRDFAARLGSVSLKIESFAGFDHGCCWSRVWPQALAGKP